MPVFKSSKATKLSRPLRIRMECAKPRFDRALHDLPNFVLALHFVFYRITSAEGEQVAQSCHEDSNWVRKSVG